MDAPNPSPKKGKDAKPGPDPMGEENFPRNNPTRRSADEKMSEPSNVRPSNDPLPRRTPPTQEGAAGSEGGETGTQGE